MRSECAAGRQRILCHECTSKAQGSKPIDSWLVGADVAELSSCGYSRRRIYRVRFFSLCNARMTERPVCGLFAARTKEGKPTPPGNGKPRCIQRGYPRRVGMDAREISRDEQQWRCGRTRWGNAAAEPPGESGEHQRPYFTAPARRYPRYRNIWAHFP